MFKNIAIIAVFLFLISCGGGTEEKNETGDSDLAPTADIILETTVTTGAVVQLDASNSFDPEEQVLTYNWSLSAKPDGSNAALSNTSDVTSNFTADVAGTFTVSLVVNDGSKDSSAATVSIVASSTNSSPTDGEEGHSPGNTTTNTEPVANAGEDQIVQLNTLTTLDGSDSSDANDDALTFSWTLTTKPNNSKASISNPTVQSPTFTTDIDGIYIISLVVNDGEISSLVDTVRVTTQTQVQNLEPTARAGIEQEVPVLSQVFLDGSNSSDPEQAQLFYMWTIVGKPANSIFMLMNTTSVNPSFTPDLPGTYTFSLVVNDGTLESEVDEVIVIVNKINELPIADAGSNVKIETGKQIQLDGTGSSDPDGDQLNYYWTIDNAPVGSIAILRDELTDKPSFTPDVEGNYLVTLVVIDANNHDSIPVSITVTATTSPVNNARFIGDFLPDVNCESGEIKILDSNFLINGVNVLGVTAEGGLEFTANTVLESSCYLTQDQLQIPPNVQLTILPNTIIMFGNRTAGLTVLGGNIIADGTPTAPIYFTGEGANPLKWAGIRVYRRNSLDNIFDYTVIEHAGSGHYTFTNAAFSVAHHPYDNNQIKGRITFTNNVIRDTAPQSQFASYAFLAQHHSYFNEISNNTIYRNPVEPISITVNEVHFLDRSNKFNLGNIDNPRNKIVITNSLLNGDETLDTLNSPEAGNMASVTWQKQEIPYLLEDNIQISNTALIIEAGAELQFLESAGIRVVGDDASLSAIGTNKEIITFTKADSDALREQTNSWLGIQFNSSKSFNNNFNYVDILYGGGGVFMKANLVLTNFSQVSVSNSKLQHSQEGYGIDVDRTSWFDTFSDNKVNLNAAGAGLVAVQALDSLDTSTDFKNNLKGYLEVNMSYGNIEGAATIPGINVPYAFYDDFNVNGSLTINAGAELLFAEGKGMEIRSNVLFAIGESGKPILFASLEPLLSGGISYWDGLLFNSSTGSTLEYVTVRNAGFRDGFNNGQAGIRIVSNGQPFSRVQIDNITVDDMELNAHGIYVDANSELFTNDMDLNNISNGICQESLGMVCK